MNSRSTPSTSASRVTIRVSGQLFQGHLPYLEQLVQSAAECRLWPQLDLLNLEELDRAGLSYLLAGENRDFGILSCPNFVRERMDGEHGRSAA
jgi:hypothetical protein